MKQKFWVALSSIEEIGSSFINKTYAHFQDIEKVFNADLKSLSEVEGLKKTSIEGFLRLRDKTDIDKAYNTVLERGIKLLSIEDSNYPTLLKQIHNPPPVLYIQGDLDKCNLGKTLAVVGSRRASSEGRRNLTKILSDFVNTDICIVSGLASGIDSVAHKTSVENNIQTIGVIASGFDFVYPSENKYLYEQIKNGAGAILTEYYPTFQPLKFRFPERNRIVSGLSYGTLIAEAALKSGALITANLTLEQNRELMCMPGSISNINTQGIYKLIKQGAALVTSAEDILEVLGWKVDLLPLEEQPFEDLSEEELNIIELLKVEKLGFDEIQSLTNINIDDLLTNLTTLELKGIIKQVDCDKYVIL